MGGHTRLLLLNQSTVIKPLNIRELDFYQNIPHDIEYFVPKYKGMVNSRIILEDAFEKMINNWNNFRCNASHYNGWR